MFYLIKIKKDTGDLYLKKDRRVSKLFRTTSYNTYSWTASINEAHKFQRIQHVNKVKHSLVKNNKEMEKNVYVSFFELENVMNA